MKPSDLKEGVELCIFRLLHPYQTIRETIEVRRLKKLMDKVHTADEKFEIFIQIMDCQLAVWREYKLKYPR